MTNIPFPTYAFKALGTNTARTMPERLAEEKNVLDYGADPSSANDSTVAIQTAMNDAVSSGAGVYLPVGTYKVTNTVGSNSALHLNPDADFGFYMRGAGGSASTILSQTCTGFLIDRSLATPNNSIGPRVFENMCFLNSVGGGLRIGSSKGVVVRNCRFSCAGTGLTTEDSPGNSSENIVIDTCNFAASPAYLTSTGLIMGGSGSVVCSDFNGMGIGVILYGKGISLNGNRCERCDVAFKLGVDSANTDQGLHGFLLTAQEMEGLVTFVDIIGTMTGFTIGPLGCTGHDIGNSGLGGFEENSQYGVRIRANKAYYGEFVATGSTQFMDIGGIYMEDYAATGLGKRSYITFSSCNPSVGFGGGVPWRIPTASGWPRLIECSAIDSSQMAPYGTRYTYSGLPTGGDVLEGDEFDISDGNNGTIGGTVTAGGGSNRIRVRWNGTNWICLPG
jgi:hypothetical protein